MCGTTVVRAADEPVPRESAPARSESSGDAVGDARRLAKAGRRADALRVLEARLASEPSDTEARTLLGTVLSWEGRYDEAREQLAMVLTARSGHSDAVQALINVELWSGHPASAESIASEALRSSPSSIDLLLAHAKALSALKRVREARADIAHVLVLDPNNEPALQMKSILKQSARPWQAGLTYAYDWFKGDPRASWREEQFSLRRETPYGSITGRCSRANHFGTLDDQVEIEAYPRIRPGTYLYMNYGHSLDSNVVFPDYRAGLELYESLGKGFEASAGYRRLFFPRNTDAPGGGADARNRATRVNIYTASLAKYYGDWLFTGRVYWLPNSDSRSRSYHVSARRYFGGGASYLGLRYARGSFREESRTVDQFSALNFDTVAGELDIKLAPRWELSARASTTREERLGTNDLRQNSASVGIFYSF